MQVIIKRDNTRTINGIVKAGPMDLPVSEAIRLMDSGEAEPATGLRAKSVPFARVNGAMKGGMVR
jgi:hypothetical protein